VRITQQEMSFCKTCNKQTLQLYNADNCNHILHLLLSVFTVGFWIPVWIMCGLSSGRGQPTCTVCGTKASGKSIALQVVTALAGIFVVFALIGSCHPKNNSDVTSSTPLSHPEASAPTSSDTRYVNQLVLTDGKYVDAATPEPNATPASIWTKEELKAYFGHATPIPLLGDEQSTAAFNLLQDRLHKPHAKSVWYDKESDSYVWRGPKTGKRMSMPRAQFEGEIDTQYLKAQ
jgi:hypothetical protein